MIALDAKNEDSEHAIDLFFKKLSDIEDDVFDQLLDRFDPQKHPPD